MRLLLLLLMLLVPSSLAHASEDIMVNDGTTSVLENFSTKANDEATVTVNNAEVFRGTFADCWEYLRAGNWSGTITLQQDIFTSSTYYTSGVNAKMQLNLNGHTIYAHADSTVETLFQVSNCYFEIVDYNNIPHQTRFLGKETPHNYSVSTNTLTYSVAEVTDYGNGDGTYLVEHTVNMNGVGGISVLNYREIVYCLNGYLTVRGGFYRSNCNSRLVYTVWAASTVTIDGGIFYNFGSPGGTGGLVYFLSGVSCDIRNCVIIGCDAYNGAAIAAYATVYTDNVVVTQCTSYNGALWASNSDASLNNTTVCLCPGTLIAAVHYYMPTTENVCKFVATGCNFLCNTSISGKGIQVENINGNTFTACKFLGNNVKEALISQLYSSPLAIADTAVVGNTAASAVTVNSATSVVGSTVIRDNIGYNVYIPSGLYLLVSEDFTDGADIHFYAEDVPNTGADVLVVENTVSWVPSVIDSFASDSGYYLKEVENKLYLTVTNPDDFIIRKDCVTFQYYAWLPRVSRTSDTGTLLNMIDTRGGNLPSNKLSLPVISMYMGDNGRIVIEDSLLQLYKDRYYEGSDSFDVDESANIFDSMQYIIDELWYPKDGINIRSTNRDDFTVVKYQPGMVINAPNGTLIRVVFNYTKEEINTEVLFYDYDITDGGYYVTYDDWQEAVNQKYTSSAIDAINAGTVLLLRTEAYGINSDENYHDDSPHLSFGNSNMGVAHQDDVFWDNGVRVFINRFNRSTSGTTVFSGCAFGIPDHLDENGDIVYRDNISVPYLFSEGPAIGKTTYRELQLVWDREGDMYTLSAVHGAEPYCQNLRDWFHPSPTAGTVYTNIWTNDFWPLDNVISAGGDGHDMKVGEWNAIQKSLIRYNDSQVIPASDCGHAHNAYFGMHFEFNFSVPEGYLGPMEYQFFGDDDMWVFLDGQLVCDIGGIHSAVGEFVDLSDYVDRDDPSEHTLSVFFTERGASGSTCWIRFYLPSAMPATDLFTGGQISFSKVDEYDEAVQGATFGLYQDADCTKLLSSVSSSDEGNVTFTDLKENAIYFVKEISPADSTYVLDEQVYVVQQNEYNVWVMRKLGDVSLTPVTSVMNSRNFIPIMPNTGGNLLRYLFAVSLLIVSGFFMLSIVIKEGRY